MSNKKSSNSIGFVSLIQLAFIVMKLIPSTSVASWSWWWVLSPTWISTLIALSLISIIFLVLPMMDKYFTKKKVNISDHIDSFRTKESKYMQKLREVTNKNKN